MLAVALRRHGEREVRRLLRIAARDVGEHPPLDPAVGEVVLERRLAHGFADDGRDAVAVSREDRIAGGAGQRIPGERHGRGEVLRAVGGRGEARFFVLAGLRADHRKGGSRGLHRGAVPEDRLDVPAVRAGGGRLGERGGGGGRGGGGRRGGGGGGGGG